MYLFICFYICALKMNSTLRASFLPLVVNVLSNRLFSTAKRICQIQLLGKTTTEWISKLCLQELGFRILLNGRSCWVSLRVMFLSFMNLPAVVLVCLKEEYSVVSSLNQHVAAEFLYFVCLLLSIWLKRKAGKWNKAQKWKSVKPNTSQT